MVSCNRGALLPASQLAVVTPSRYRSVLEHTTLAHILGFEADMPTPLYPRITPEMLLRQQCQIYTRVVWCTRACHVMQDSTPTATCGSPLVVQQYQYIVLYR